jgi:hypothetical protein
MDGLPGLGSVDTSVASHAKLDNWFGPAMVFVFGGCAEMIEVHTARFRDHRSQLYTLGWERIEVKHQYDEITGDLARPPHLLEMIEAAETLGKELDFIRVDFYDTLKKLYFGEFTTGPGGGLESFQPEAFDCQLGERWVLPPSLASRVWSPRKPATDRQN